MLTPLLCCLLFTSGADLGGARLQLGSQKAEYQVTSVDGAPLFPGYRNNGYRQRMTDAASGGLEVSVRNRQLSSKQRGRKVAGLPPQMASLEDALNLGTKGLLADQVVTLFSWIRQEIEYDAENGQRKVDEVLGNARADCVGMANLAMFVLDRMGVKSRYVTGVALRPEDASRLTLEGNVLHRWIEVYYNDVGWVFCDPAGKVNFVEATYLVLGVQDVHPLPDILERALGSKVELLRFKNGMRTVGRSPEVDSRIRVRPNRLFL